MISRSHLEEGFRSDEVTPQIGYVEEPHDQNCE